MTVGNWVDNREAVLEADNPAGNLAGSREALPAVFPVDSLAGTPVVWLAG